MVRLVPVQAQHSVFHNLQYLVPAPVQHQVSLWVHLKVLHLVHCQVLCLVPVQAQLIVFHNMHYLVSALVQHLVPLWVQLKLLHPVHCQVLRLVPVQAQHTVFVDLHYLVPAPMQHLVPLWVQPKLLHTAPNTLLSSHEHWLLRLNNFVNYMLDYTSTMAHYSLFWFYAHLSLLDFNNQIEQLFVKSLGW